jgi:hypothetical protein
MYLGKNYNNYECSQYKSDDEKNKGIRTLSLGELFECVENAVQTANRNNIDIYSLPAFIESNNELFCIESTSTAFGSRIGMTFRLNTEFTGNYNQRIHYVAPDERPEEGEYWTSRGIGYDLSGFVKSKLSGERLLRMVKLVLETDEPKSWLDYREDEPNWIQFKFQKEEFDLEKLNDMSQQNNDIITLNILKECKI